MNKAVGLSHNGRGGTVGEEVGVLGGYTRACVICSTDIVMSCCSHRFFSHQAGTSNLELPFRFSQ